MSHNDFKAHAIEASNPLKEDDDGCAGARAGLPRRQDYGFSLSEDVCLDVVRELLATYMTADARHWHGALEFAETHLGDVEAANIVARATNFVRALRVERRCPFNFLSFGCSHITGDELALVSALQAGQMSNRYEFQDAVQYLAQSSSCARLERATLALAELLTALEPEGNEATSPAGGTRTNEHKGTDVRAKLH